jgi:adenylate cyclase
MGYAVHVAARLQNASKELNNSFIVSQAAFQLLSTPPARYQQMSLALRPASLAGVSAGRTLRAAGSPSGTLSRSYLT